MQCFSQFLVKSCYQLYVRSRYGGTTRTTGPRSRRNLRGVSYGTWTWLCRSSGCPATTGCCVSRCWNTSPTRTSRSYWTMWYDQPPRALSSAGRRRTSPGTATSTRAGPTTSNGSWDDGVWRSTSRRRRNCVAPPRSTGSKITRSSTAFPTPHRG